MMSEEAKKRIQIALALAIVVAGVRAGYILYERHEDYVAAQKQQAGEEAGYSNADYYVTPKKLYPYDLKSAKQLTLQPVWVKEGYRYTYYRYVPVVKSVDFVHEAGTVGADRAAGDKRRDGGRRAGRQEAGEWRRSKKIGHRLRGADRIRERRTVQDLFR
jgi:hypothetical protein